MNASDASGDSEIHAILESCYAELQEGRDPDLERLCPPELRDRVERLLGMEGAAIGHLEGVGRVSIPEVDGFRVVRALAQGGMGDVFVAEQVALGREVALKILPRFAMADPLRRLRFRREAELAAAIDHPNIIPVYATGESDGRVFIAMKLVDGESLDKLSAPLAAKDAAAIGEKIALALGAAHAVGIVHRDVKPANVVVDRDGEPVLLDFGLARGSSDATITREGQSPGTLAYMAPEQMMADATGRLDPKMDVYSLGATIYQLVAGKPPFVEPSAELLTRRILFHDPIPLRLPRAARDLETLIFRALEKVAAHRFESMQAFADELRRFVEDRPIRTRPPGLARRALKIVRRNRAMSAVIATSVVVSVVLIGLLWKRTADHAREIRARRDAIETAVRSGDYWHAWHRVGEVRDPDAADRALGARVRAILAREACLTELAVAPLYGDERYLRALMDRVDDAQVRASVRMDLARLVLACLVRDGDAVRRFLSNEGILDRFPVTVQSIVANATVFDPSPPSSTSPTLAAVSRTPSTPGTASADDHTFAAAVLWSAEAPLDSVVAHLERSMTIDRGNTLAAYVRAVLHVDSGDVERAEQLLLGLERGPHVAPELHEAMARIAFLRGERGAFDERLEIARRTRASASLPETIGTALLRYRAALAWGGQDDADRMVAEFERTWPGHPRWSMLRGEAAVRAGDYARASAAYVKAEREAASPWIRRWSALALLQADCAEFLRRADAFTHEGRRIDRASLAGRAVGLAKRAESAHAGRVAGDALMVGVLLLEGANDRRNDRRKERLLDRALALDPMNARANYLYVRRVAADTLDLQNSLPDGIEPRDYYRLIELGADIAEARRAARRIAEAVDAGRRHLDAPLLEQLLLDEVFLALSADDPDAADAPGQAAHRLQQRRGATPDDPNVRYLAAIAERLGREPFGAR